jgi:O-antigen/teichoic acid export membrane protein
MSSSEGALHGIRRRLLGGLGWNAGGMLAQAIVQFGATIVLARLLGPGPFGLAAMAWAVITPLGVLADGGLGQAIVQRRRLRDEEIGFCFWAQVSAGSVLAVILCALSPWLSELFAHRTLEPILLAYSGILILQGVSATSFNLMRRYLEFHKLQLVQVSSVLAANTLVAIPLAFLGAGVWSLVAASISIAALQAVASYSLTRHTLRLRLGRGHERFITISPKYLLLSLINVAGLSLIPRLIIGRSFGSESLGLFDRAHSLIVAPMGRAAATVDGVLFAAHARSVKRGGFNHGELYLASVTGALLIALPTSAAIVMNGPAIIEVLLGDQWVGAVDFVAPLSALIPLFFLIQVSVPVLNGLGRPGVEIIVQIAVIVVFMISALLLPRTAVDVIWALVAAYALRTVCLTICVARITTVSARKLIAAAIPGAAAVCTVLLFNHAGRAALPAGLSPMIELAGLLAGSGAVALGTYVTWWKLFGVPPFRSPLT